jgi:hypothetical protein
MLCGDEVTLGEDAPSFVQSCEAEGTIRVSHHVKLGQRRPIHHPPLPYPRQSTSVSTYTRAPSTRAAVVGGTLSLLVVP